MALCGFPTVAGPKCRYEGSWGREERCYYHSKETDLPRALPSRDGDWIPADSLGAGAWPVTVEEMSEAAHFI